VHPLYPRPVALTSTGLRACETTTLKEDTMNTMTSNSEITVEIDTPTGPRVTYPRVSHFGDIIEALVGTGLVPDFSNEIEIGLGMLRSPLVESRRAHEHLR